MMLYQPHMFRWRKLGNSSSRYVSLHALACFRHAHWVFIPSHDKRWHVNCFERRSCIVAQHPKHTSRQYSRRGLQLEAGYEIKFLASP
jgi:hypothetical protein